MAGGGKPRTNLSRSSRRGSWYITTAAALLLILCVFFLLRSARNPGKRRAVRCGSSDFKGHLAERYGPSETKICSTGVQLARRGIISAFRIHGNEGSLFPKALKKQESHSDACLVCRSLQRAQAPALTSVDRRRRVSSCSSLTTVEEPTAEWPPQISSSNRHYYTPMSSMSGLGLVRCAHDDLVRESASCSVTKPSEAPDAATAAYMLSYTRPSGRDR